MISISKGDRIKFTEEKQAYEVKVANDRYAICTKPFNLKKTVLYTIIDFQQGIRGTDNYRGLGYESDEDCNNVMAMLESGVAEVSHRNRVVLRIDQITFN